MKKSAYLAAAAGLTLFVALIVHEGAAGIFSALSLAGWNLIWVAAFQGVPITFAALGWYELMSRKGSPPLHAVVWARWVSESFNTLLPVAQVGGHYVRARMITRYGVTGSEAGAAVVVDLTAGITAQFIFVLLGAVLLLGLKGTGGDMTGIFAGIAVGFLIILAFYLSQVKGLFSSGARFAHAVVGSRKLLTLVGGTEALERKILETYRRRRDVLVCFGWRLLSWTTKTGETWLALHFLGIPVTIIEAMIIESLTVAVSSAFFMVPGALGVREGGLVIIAGLMGITPQIALALALVKRVRELLVGVPGLASWLIAEGRHVNQRAEG